MIYRPRGHESENRAFMFITYREQLVERFFEALRPRDGTSRERKAKPWSGLWRNVTKRRIVTPEVALITLQSICLTIRSRLLIDSLTDSIRVKSVYSANRRWLIFSPVAFNDVVAVVVVEVLQINLLTFGREYECKQISNHTQLWSILGLRSTTTISNESWIYSSGV